MIMDFASHPLSENYVYYERLRNFKSRYPTYKEAKEYLSDFDTTLGKIDIASDILKMARDELKKEKAALEKIFGINISMDFYTVDAAKTIIEAFNSVLNLKKAYERNIARIKAGEVKIDIATFFVEYFNPIYNQNIGVAIDRVYNKWMSNPSVDAMVLLDQELSTLLPDLVEQTIIKMLKSKDFKNGDADKRAYLDILENINKFPSGFNWLKKQLYELYNLDELKQYIMNDLSSSITISPTQRRAISSLTSKSILKRSASKAGITREYFENYITNFLLNTDINGVKITGGQSTHSGASQMKADNIISFNIPVSQIQDAIDEVKGNSRQQTIEVLEKLNKKLKNVTDGVIIYSNAKNYTLNKTFKGFSAGEDISINVLKGIIEKVDNGKVTRLIWSILQTAKGAIGESNKKKLEDVLAKYVAYFLFDDFDTIGVQTSSLTALHIFDLDGIFIPLSFFLWLIGQAMELTLSVPVGILDINIQTPDIIYPDTEKNIRRTYSESEWNEQRTISLSDTYISVRFLKNFTNIVKQFL